MIPHKLSGELDPNIPSKTQQNLFKLHNPIKNLLHMRYFFVKHFYPFHIKLYLNYNLF